MLSRLTVRLARAEDAPHLRRVHEAAFGSGAEASLVEQLVADGDASLSLVALVGDERVGHLLFSPVTVCHERCDGLGLAPLGVHPTWQRRGVGSKLVTAGLAACRRRGVGFVVVLGDPEYYQRFGFEPAADRGLGNEYGATSAFAVIELRTGGIPAAGGVARYAPAFAALA
jgi:putative acetyltransferase